MVKYILYDLLNYYLTDLNFYISRISKAPDCIFFGWMVKIRITNI